MQKILIIEDEMNIAELERDYLEANGFESDIATTGEEGLKLARTNSYNLIILDLMLPGMDGFSLSNELRKTLDIPILMVTARKGDIDKIIGFDRGADDYIVKPFNPNELVARVKAHISRYDRLINRDKKQNDIQIRGLIIHNDSRRVLYNGNEKTFTAKEFDLLNFLATNANIVFSKEYLFERIWGYDAIGDTSTVTVHIRKIREKIEEDPSNPQFIETIWGVGYRFKR
ncbi:response regulator transcription factor [Heyndrickxia oleronia]|uniref:response regulator transcription factor n=1 Tax=Heyndrickxia oleronia TaxID=38875 RepID=UPI00203D8145|nr:response regulator transcription factor [Heyndrickxia oleronia]MCM3239577.1 response regulator transcription factor [Heyndrickxia oleronia]